MRIQGITLPDNKRMEIALTTIYGIGRARAQKILKDSGVEFGVQSTTLTVEQENKIREIVDGFKVEGDLRREIGGNIKRYKDILCYRGMRHSRRLPVRGQRTKTNSRTVRGNARKTMGSGKRAVEKK